MEDPNIPDGNTIVILYSRCYICGSYHNRPLFHGHVLDCALCHRKHCHNCGAFYDMQDEEDRYVCKNCMPELADRRIQRYTAPNNTPWCCRKLVPILSYSV
jgi:hypothetical protein